MILLAEITPVVFSTQQSRMSAFVSVIALENLLNDPVTVELAISAAAVLSRSFIELLALSESIACLYVMVPLAASHSDEFHVVR